MKAIFSLPLLLCVTTYAHADLGATHLARASGLMRFYADATKLIWQNGDTISGHDFSTLNQLVKAELKTFPQNPLPGFFQKEADYILAQINDSNLNSDRLSHPKKWLQDLSQTLEFAHARTEYLLRRYQIEKKSTLLPSEIRLIESEAATQGFIELVTQRSDVFHGSYIITERFTNKKRVKSYLTQIINNQALTFQSAPQIDVPLNNPQLDIVVKQAAQLQFDYRQKVQRNVSSL